MNELWKDPKWQKKRLEILERDGWRCRICKSDIYTLNVHHLYYKKDKKPWEYPKTSLITLCESCHEEEHGNRKDEEDDLLFTLKEEGFTSFDIEFLSENIRIGKIKSKFL